MSDYEPPAEMVEALIHEMERDVLASLSPLGKENVARFVLRRQHERECGLLEALKRIRTFYDVSGYSYLVARDALAAHAKLDAPKVPTLLEAAKAMVAPLGVTREHQLVSVALYDALKAAVEREEKR